MKIGYSTPPGTHMCLVKEINNEEWTMSNLGSYEACVSRAQELVRTGKLRSVLIAEVIATATPSTETAWSSKLIDKLTK